MKYWTICYPDCTSLGESYTKYEILSDSEIIDRYWQEWFTNMIHGNRPEFELTEDNCIKDWGLVHKAKRNYWREMRDYFQ